MAGADDERFRVQAMKDGKRTIAFFLTEYPIGICEVSVTVLDNKPQFVYGTCWVAAKNDGACKHAATMAKRYADSGGLLSAPLAGGIPKEVLEQSMTDTKLFRELILHKSDVLHEDETDW